MKACLHLLISWLVCIALAAIGSGARAEMPRIDSSTATAKAGDTTPGAFAVVRLGTAAMAAVCVITES